MNKTFTIIVATVALAGLAFANIETPPAGYLEKSGAGTFVCNPFGTFNGTPRLADLDGSELASGTIRIINETGLATTYYWRSGKWYTTETGGEDSSIVSLPRGACVQIAGGGTLVAAGPLMNVDITDQSVGQGFSSYGNASATTGKRLKDIRVTGQLDPNKDYVLIGGTKYVTTDGSAWYEKVAYDGGSRVDVKNTVALAEGEGVIFFRQKPRRGSLSEVTVTLPGTY